MSRRKRKQTAAEKKQTPAVKPAHTGMGLKSIVTVVLLLFVVTSVVYLVLSDSFAQGESPGRSDAATIPVPTAVAPSVTPPDEAEEPQRRVIAYYFHGTYRCATCLAIEQYTHEALTAGFTEELASGVLEWRVVNVEEADNQHFIDDYQLYTKAVVLVEMEGETQVRWKNLERIWDLVNDQAAFVAYIQDETRVYLQETP